MDSNRKLLEPKRMAFKPNQTVSILPCPAYSKLPEVFEKYEFKNVKYILIHLGVNDLDQPNQYSIPKTIQDAQILINTKYPNTHIFISEIIPRMDKLDIRVQQINTKLRNIFSQGDTLIHHDNLRHQQYYRDERHIKDSKIQILAGNIKNNIRRILKSAQNKSTSNHYPQYVSTPSKPNYTPTVYNNPNPASSTHYPPLLPQQLHRPVYIPQIRYPQQIPTNMFRPEIQQPPQFITNSNIQQPRFHQNTANSQGVSTYSDIIKKNNPEVIMQQIQALLQQYTSSKV